MRKVRNVMVTDKLEIANKLNLYFNNIGSNLAKVYIIMNKEFASYLIRLTKT